MNNETLHLLYIRCRGLLRGIKNNNYRSNYADEAAHFTNETQSLFEKDCRKHSRDNNRQSTQWSDQYRIDATERLIENVIKARRSYKA